jgi:hypothetical protein
MGKCLERHISWQPPNVNFLKVQQTREEIAAAHTAKKHSSLSEMHLVLSSEYAKGLAAMA